MKSRRSKPLSQEVKQENRRVARILREAGLLQRKAGKRITDRYLQQSSTFRRARKEFADVIAGLARPAKASKSEIAKFKAAGFKVKRNRVIVPSNVKPHQVRLAAKQLPPPPPRPPRRPRFKGHAFDDCLERVIEWLTYNYDNRFGLLETRIAQLRYHAAQHPNMFRDIVNASHVNGEQYLAGLPPLRDLWPEGPINDLFKSLYDELYYYHPSEYAYAVTGGLIPKC